MSASPSATAELALLPNFLICGAPKAGTSSLHLWLADHPDALGSVEKETYFFVDAGTHMYRPSHHVSGGMDLYTRFFLSENGQKPKVVFESTPSYIYYETALRMIPSLPSNPKCLFVLREPSRQIFSLFTYFKNNWAWIPRHMTFERYIEIIRENPDPAKFRGNELAAHALAYARYVDYLLRWREQLGAERMKVVAYEDLRDNPRAFISSIAHWLDLDPQFYETYEFPRDNETYTVNSGLLQHVNLKIRSKLPRGRAYEVLRGLYRRINTRKPAGPQEGERRVIGLLFDEYKGPNARLRSEFDLKLESWA